MGTEYHGMPFSQIPDQAPDLCNLLGVQPYGGFIQDQHRGIADKRLGQPYPLLISFGQIADQPSLYFLQLDPLTDLLQMFLPRLLYSFEFIGKFHIFPDSHVLI